MSNQEQHELSGSYDLGLFFENLRDAKEEAEARNRREQELFAERVKPKPTEVVQGEAGQPAERPAEKTKVLTPRAEKVLFADGASKLEPEAKSMSEPAEPVSSAKTAQDPAPRNKSKPRVRYKPSMTPPHEAILTDSDPEYDPDPDPAAMYEADVREAIREAGIRLDGLGVILSDNNPRIEND